MAKMAAAIAASSSCPSRTVPKKVKQKRISQKKLNEKSETRNREKKERKKEAEKNWQRSRPVVHTESFFASWSSSPPPLPPSLQPYTAKDGN